MSYTNSKNTIINQNNVNLSVSGVNHLCIISWGNKEYLDKVETFEFNVTKKSVTDFSVNVSSLGDYKICVNITHGVGVTGWCVVYINETEYLVNMDDDALEVSVAGAGFYNVTVSYQGNDFFNPYVVNKNITVEDIIVPYYHILVGGEYFVGDMVNFTVDVPNMLNSFDVSVISPDNSMTSINHDDEGVYSFTPASVGFYQIFVSSSGVSGFEDSFNVTGFSVVKRPVNVSVILPDNITVGEEFNFNVNVVDALNNNPVEGVDVIVRVDDENVNKSGDVYSYCPSRQGYYVLSVNVDGDLYTRFFYAK